MAGPIQEHITPDGTKSPVCPFLEISNKNYYARRQWKEQLYGAALAEPLINSKEVSESIHRNEELNKDNNLRK
jgi:hypothetical protein